MPSARRRLVYTLVDRLNSKRLSAERARLPGVERALEWLADSTGLDEERVARVAVGVLKDDLPLPIEYLAKDAGIERRVRPEWIARRGPHRFLRPPLDYGERPSCERSMLDDPAWTWACWALGTWAGLDPGRLFDATMEVLGWREWPKEWRDGKGWHGTAKDELPLVRPLFEKAVASLAATESALERLGTDLWSEGGRIKAMILGSEVTLEEWEHALETIRGLREAIERTRFDEGRASRVPAWHAEAAWRAARLWEKERHEDAGVRKGEIYGESDFQKFAKRWLRLLGLEPKEIRQALEKQGKVTPRAETYTQLLSQHSPHPGEDAESAAQAVEVETRGEPGKE